MSKVKSPCEGCKYKNDPMGHCVKKATQLATGSKIWDYRGISGAKDYEYHRIICPDLYKALTDSKCGIFYDHEGTRQETPLLEEPWIYKTIENKIRWKHVTSYDDVEKFMSKDGSEEYEDGQDAQGGLIGDCNGNYAVIEKNADSNETRNLAKTRIREFGLWREYGKFVLRYKSFSDFIFNNIEESYLSNFLDILSDHHNKIYKFKAYSRLNSYIARRQKEKKSQFLEDIFTYYGIISARLSGLEEVILLSFIENRGLLSLSGNLKNESIDFLLDHSPVGTYIGNDVANGASLGVCSHGVPLEHPCSRCGAKRKLKLGIEMTFLGGNAEYALEHIDKEKHKRPPTLKAQRKAIVNSYGTLKMKLGIIFSLDSRGNNQIYDRLKIIPMTDKEFWQALDDKRKDISEEKKIDKAYKLYRKLEMERKRRMHGDEKIVDWKDIGRPRLKAVEKREKIEKYKKLEELKRSKKFWDVRNKFRKQIGLPVEVINWQEIQRIEKKEDTKTRQLLYVVEQGA